MVICGRPEDFNWTHDSAGLEISEGPERLCLTAYKCMLPTGSQGDCGDYVEGTCTPVGAANCAWRVFGTPVMQPTWVQGAACNPR